MDRNTLVSHLARTFPAWADREAIVRGANLQDVQITGDPRPAWAHLVEEAERQDRLDGLLRAAWRRRPRDRVLAAAAGEEPVASSRFSSFGIWGALGGLILVATVAQVWDRSPDAGPKLMPLPPVGAAARAPGAPPAVAAAPAGAGAVEATDAAAAAKLSGAVLTAEEGAGRATPAIGIAPPAGEALDPVAPPAIPKGAAAEEQPPSEDVLGRLRAIPQPAVAEPAAPVAAPAAPAAGVPKGGRSVCGGAVGYAYVAEGRVPRMGEVWTVPRSLNVRADFPRVENGWDSRSAVTCVLPPGARVRVSDRPVPIEGGAVWVPIHDAWLE